MKKYWQKFKLYFVRKLGKKHLLVFLLSIFVFIFVSYVSLVYLSGPDKWILAAKIPASVRSVGRVVTTKVANLPYFGYYFSGHGLPVYNINVSNLDIDFLNSKLPTKPSAQLTEDNKVYVPATFTFDNTVYKGRLRYRGVSRNHWLWPKKSMRFQFDTDNFFNGAENLNLIVPQDRLYFVEELNQYRARKLGLAVPRSEFVVVTINGKKPAVYWATGQFDREFLERTNNFTANANLYAEGDSYIEDRRDETLYQSVVNWKKYNEGVHNGKDDFTEVNKLIGLLLKASDEDFVKNIFNILDKESFYNWSIQNALVFGNHQDWEHNMKLYFDTSVGKFKMIPWDVAIRDISSEAFLPNEFEEHSNPLSNRILGFSQFMEERNKLLWEYVKNDEQLNDDLAYYDSLVKKVSPAFYLDTIKRGINKQFDRQVEYFRGVVKSNIKTLQKYFVGVEPVFATLTEKSPQAASLVINTQSLSPFSIESLELTSGDGAVFSLVGSKEIKPNIVRLSLPSPSATYPIVNDFYQAFQLQTQKTEVEVGSNIPVDWTGVSGKVLIKNLYTGEVIDIIL